MVVKLEAILTSGRHRHFLHVVTAVERVLLIVLTAVEAPERLWPPAPPVGLRDGELYLLALLIGTLAIEQVRVLLVLLKDIGS